MGTNGAILEHKTFDNDTGCRIQQQDLDRREKNLVTLQKKITNDIALAQQERSNQNMSYTENMDCLSNALSDSMRKCHESESAVKDLHEQLEISTSQSQSDAKTLQIDTDSRVEKLKKRVMSAKNTLAESNRQHNEICQTMKEQSAGTVAPMTLEIKTLKTQLKKYEAEVYKLVKTNEANVNDHLDSKKKTAYANAANIAKVSQDLKSMYENDAKKENTRTQSIIEQHEDRLCRSQTESKSLVEKIKQYESKSNEGKGTDNELQRLCSMIVSSLPDHVKNQNIATQERIVNKVLQSMGQI